MIEVQLQKELDEAKMQGLEAVRKLIGQYKFKRVGYHLVEIASPIASNILMGKYKSIEELRSDNENNTSIKDITLLYQTQQHPITRDDIVVINTFFIKYKS